MSTVRNLLRGLCPEVPFVDFGLGGEEAAVVAAVEAPGGQKAAGVAAAAAAGSIDAVGGAAAEFRHPSVFHDVLPKASECLGSRLCRLWPIKIGECIRFLRVEKGHVSLVEALGSPARARLQHQLEPRLVLVPRPAYTSGGAAVAGGGGELAAGSAVSWMSP